MLPSAEPSKQIQARETTAGWDRLAAEIDRLNRADPRAALTQAEDWLEAERSSGSSEGYARALRAHAHTLRFLGRYEAATGQYEEAERLFGAIGLDGEAARTQIGHVTALRYQGRYQEAVKLAQSSRAYFLGRGDELQAAKQANNLGTVYRRMGRLTAAVKSYREARAVLRRLNQRSPLADVEQNLGNVLVDLGRYEEALTSLRTAERIRRSLGLHSEVGLTLLNIGLLLYRRGDYGGSLQALTEAKNIFDSLGLERGKSNVDLALLPTYTALNLAGESREAAERAIAGLRALEMPFELGQALLAAGALVSATDHELARERTSEARQLFERTGNRLWAATAQLQDTQLAMMAADPHELQTALLDCRQATRRLQLAGALDRAALGELIEGRVLVGLGEHDEALRCFRRVLKTASGVGADHLLYQAHAAIGEVLAATAPDAAIASYRLAIDHLEAVRARALADDLKVSFLADKTDLYQRLVGLLIRDPSPAAVSEAYTFVERSKSRTLLEELLARDWRTPRGGQSRIGRLTRRVRDIRTRLNTAYTTAYGTDEVPSSDSVGRSGQAELVAELEQEFATATRELQLAARAEQTDLLAAGGGETRLPPGTALIEFYAVGQNLLAFVKTEDGLRLRPLTTLDEVAQLADGLNLQISRAIYQPEHARANPASLRRGTDHFLTALWREVIAPLERDLGGRERLVVVPHGPLHGLPFHAFYDGERYLAERFVVSYAPSAAVYESCLRAARPLGERVVVVGIDDPTLPWVAQEIETVARAWPNPTVLDGARATGNALRRQAGRFDALHLATHAVFRADNPAFSSVKLADSWLTVGDFAEIAAGAQLVTLSACETGVGRLVGGEEVLGLTRGLLGAGCSMVVASLWPVSDETTAILMSHFYDQVRKGAGPVAALRSAMLALRIEYDHPYFWAPFVAIGEGRGRVNSAESSAKTSINREKKPKRVA